MSPAWLSFLALIVVIFVSRRERINVGILAMGLAWIIGSYAAGMKTQDVTELFPLPLFIILFGITFFFGLAKVNGTLDQFIRLMIRCTQGQVNLFPISVFIFAFILSMIGPGNIGTVALLAPFVMAMAAKIGMNAILMTIILVMGANAGTFSPFAPTGIIANGLVARIGLVMDPWGQIFLPNFLAHTFIALCCYIAFILRQKRLSAKDKFDMNEIAGTVSKPLDHRQKVTILAIVILILGVVFVKADIGFLAIALASVLMLAGVSEGEEAIKIVPWNVIIMVCGVSTLIGIMEKTGGLDLFTNVLARVSNTTSVTGMIALFTGLISCYSSSSGVIMPAFIPIVPELIEKLGGGDPIAIVASINVGSHVVDISPLSTLGALCIANAAKIEDKSKLFRHLFMLAFGMAFVGGGICHLFFGLLAQWF